MNERTFISNQDPDARDHAWDVILSPMGKARRLHELKTFPEFFEAVRTGLKTAELRSNDRGFMVGDVLRLVEQQEAHREAPLTGRAVDVLVTHIVDGMQFGLMAGYVMLSFRLWDVLIAAQEDAYWREASRKLATERMVSLFSGNPVVEGQSHLQDAARYVASRSV